MVYGVHERDAEWQATYQRVVDAFLQRVRSLHLDDPMADGTALDKHWIHEVAEEEADRDLARRIDRVEQAQLAQIRDDAQADLWEGWYDSDENEQFSIDAEDVPIGAAPHIKQIIDECVNGEQ